MRALGTNTPIGLGIIGSGRIGTLRARLAAAHPAVNHIAVSDLDPANAAKLATLTNATTRGADNLAVIEDPAVTAIIIATPEGEHTKPLLAAIERGKPVLVEKPIALTMRGADRILEALARHSGDLASATAAATRSATRSPRSSSSRAASAPSPAAPRAYSTRAARPSPCSPAIRTPPPSSTR